MKFSTDANFLGENKKDRPQERTNKAARCIFDVPAFTVLNGVNIHIFDYYKEVVYVCWNDIEQQSGDLHG